MAPSQLQLGTFLLQKHFVTVTPFPGQVSRNNIAPRPEYFGCNKPPYRYLSPPPLRALKKRLPQSIGPENWEDN
jgi:hypothetical protein